MRHLKIITQVKQLVWSSIRRVSHNGRYPKLGCCSAEMSEGKEIFDDLSICYVMVDFRFGRLVTKEYSVALIRPRSADDQIKTTVFLWFKLRSNKNNLDWVRWNIDPLSCK